MIQFQSQFNPFSESALQSAQYTIWEKYKTLYELDNDLATELDAKYNELVTYLVDNKATIDTHTLNDPVNGEIVTLLAQLQAIYDNVHSPLAIAKRQKEADFLEWLTVTQEAYKCSITMDNLPVAEVGISEITFNDSLEAFKKVITDNHTRTQFNYTYPPDNTSVLNIPQAKAQTVHDQIISYEQNLQNFINYYIGAKIDGVKVTNGVIYDAVDQTALDAIDFTIARTINGVSFLPSKLNIITSFEVGMVIVPAVT